MKGSDNGDNFGPPGATILPLSQYDPTIVHVDDESSMPPAPRQLPTGAGSQPTAGPSGTRQTQMTDQAGRLALMAGPAPVPRSLSEQEQILQRFVHLRDLESSLSNWMPVEFETTHL